MHVLSWFVEIPVRDCSSAKEVIITYPDAETSLACGIKGFSKRAARSIGALKFRTGADPYDALAKLGTVNEAVEYNPEKAKELAAEFMEALEFDLNRVTYISYYLRLACAGL